jgi:Ca-activated chloride channel family protein
MFSRWVDPHVRTGIALAVVILSIAGLVLADRGTPRPGWPAPPALTIAVDPAAPGYPSPPLRTSADFSGRGAHGRLAISHGKLLASGTRALYAELRVAADPVRDDAYARTPASMVLAIDTSGSMAGQKIVDARRSALAMLDDMRPDDYVAVVRFAGDAQIVVPLSRVSDARSTARQQISMMSAVGSTDIAKGLRLASTQLGWGSDERTQRIVLVTDGRDTSGAPRETGGYVARAQASRGVTVSALGIGTDYDADYLANLAELGRGNYEYLSDSSALGRFLQKELRETMRTTVRNMAATIDLPSSARVRDVWGANWERTSSGVRLTFGSLYAGDERRAVVSMDVDTQGPGSWFSLRGAASWQPAGASRVEVGMPALRVDAVASAGEAEASRDPSVYASYTSVLSSRREQEAAAAFERGDRARAIQLNAQSQADLDKAAAGAPADIASRLRAQKKAYEKHNDVYSTQQPAAAPARAIGASEHKNTDRANAY